MALSSKLEDWLFLFPALFLCPLFFPMKASVYSVGVDFAEAHFPPSNKSPHSSSSGIKVIMNFWTTSAPSQKANSLHVPKHGYFVTHQAFNT